MRVDGSGWRICRWWCNGRVRHGWRRISLGRRNRGRIGGSDYDRRQRVVGCRRHRRRRGRSPWRQEPCRVEVPLLVGVEPNAQMDVGLVHLGISARSDCPDAVAFGDCRALLNGDRSEVCERHVVSVCGLDGDRLAAGRHRARERHDSGGGSHYSGARAAADVEAAMLPRRIGLSAIEGERLQDRAVGRPGPGARRGRGGERNCKHEQESSHGTSPL